MTWIHTISDIERDTGIAKDRLRVWERRYGFPEPQRDDTDERLYDDAQLFRLRLIKRLLDLGERAGRVVPLAVDELQRRVDNALRPLTGRVLDEASDALLNDLVVMIKATDRKALHGRLMHLISERGISAVIERVIAPLGARVGEFWLSGQIAIYQEHLFTAVIRSVLIQAMEQLPLQSAAQPPLVLLATLGNERHEIGLLMAESMFAQAGCDRLSLGTSMPLNEAVAACLAVKPDIFALSFSGQNAPREVLSQLKQLRGMLPPATEVWVGGSAVALRLVTDIAIARAFTSASDIRSAIDVWRASH